MEERNTESKMDSSKAASPVSGREVEEGTGGDRDQACGKASDSSDSPPYTPSGTPLSERAKKPSLDSPRCGPGRLCQPNLLSIFIALLAVVGMGGGGAAALLFKPLLPAATALSPRYPPIFPPPPPPPPSLPAAPPTLPSPPVSPPSPPPVSPPSPPSLSSPPSDPPTCYGTASSRTKLVLCANNINKMFLSKRDVESHPTMAACYDSCDAYKATQPGEDKIGCLTPGCRRATSDPAEQGRDGDLSCEDLYFVSRWTGRVRPCMDGYEEFGTLGHLPNDDTGRTRRCGGDFVVETDPNATKARCMEARGGEDCVFQGSEKGGTIVDVANRTMYWETTSPDSGESQRGFASWNLCCASGGYVGTMA